jgi:hypothetical protein
VLIQVSLINVLDGVPARITQRLYAVYSSPAAGKLTPIKVPYLVSYRGDDARKRDANKASPGGKIERQSAQD